jgi:hypothetical protein
MIYFLSMLLIILLTASLFWTLSIRVPSKLIRDFSIFSVSKALSSSPSARCSIVANKVYQFMDIFSAKIISLNNLLCYTILLTIVLF